MCTIYNRVKQHGCAAMRNGAITGTALGVVAVAKLCSEAYDPATNDLRETTSLEKLQAAVVILPTCTVIGAITGAIMGGVFGCQRGTSDLCCRVFCCLCY